ncbi:MAG: response regulator transcription factor [Cyanobacteria bacterium P01_A01_bin.135]
MTPSPIRVLIADDHPVVRSGLAQMVNLTDGMEIIAEAKTGLEAIQRFREHQPDVTLMDLRMPEMGAVGAITAILEDFPDARIAILTTYNTDEDIFSGLKAGARGYILKDTKMADLVDAVRKVHAGQKYIPPPVGAQLAERMGLNPLSAREREVLQLMAKGKNNLEISADLTISESTVRFHVSNILSKLDARDRVQAIVIAIQRGIARV